MWELLDGLPSEVIFALLGAAAVSILRLSSESIRQRVSDARRRRRIRDFSAEFNRAHFSLGGLTSTMFVSDFQPGGYKPGSISCEVLDADPKSSEHSDRLFLESLAKWQGAVEQGRIFNGQVFALSHFRHVRGANLEEPGLHLALRQSDYVHQRATGEMFQALSADDVEIEIDGVVSSPGSAGTFSATFGAPVTVVTADGQIVWLKRSMATAVNPGRFTCTTAEGINRDDIRSGVPDPYLCAARGLHEELGIRLDAAELKHIRFIGLVLDLDWWEWTLIGVLRLADLSEHSLDARVLMQYFSSARAKDKWETGQPAFCAFEPRPVARFIRDNPVTNYAAVSASLALMADPRFRRREVVDAFSEIDVHIGRHRYRNRD